MKLAAIICEFNPLHKGHAYLIKQAKEVTNADAVICIMSPNFVQRAEPAVANMHTRAIAALKSGANAVLTIPALYATACAEKFSEGAINIANSIKSIKWLVFGSECGDIEYIKKIAKIQTTESKKFKTKLKNELASGISYPKALSLASAECLGNDIAAPNLPNDILGIEYYKQIIKQKSNITPITIKRKGAGHHDKNANNLYSSSTAVRNFLNIGNIAKVEKLLPKQAFKTFNETWNKHKVNFNIFEILTLYALKTKDLSKTPDNGEGLEVKLKKNSEIFLDLNDVINATKSKRYTHARIRRLCLQALLDITHYPLLDNFNLPTRLLGVSKKTKQKLLPLLGDNVIIKNKDEVKYLASLDSEKLEIAKYILEICYKSSSIYNLISNTAKNHLEKPLIIV